MRKITPWLWFDNQAEDAAHFYTSVFKNSRILDMSHYGEGGAGDPGSVMTVTFELDGQEFTALNGGKQDWAFSEAVSFQVLCETQDEIDDYWARLGEGGEPGPCGWLKDKYGLSWQIVPVQLQEYIGDPDPERAQRAMAAMMQMGKLDVEALRRAANGD